MIKNERQYKSTRKQVEKFKESIQNFDSMDLIRSGVDPMIAEAQLRALRGQLHELEVSLERFETLQSNPNEKLYSDNLVALGSRLIEARIARGLTQKELAERLGMKQQQIQRYEQDDYQSANLQRLSQIAAVLDASVEIQLALQSHASTTDSKFTNSIK